MIGLGHQQVIHVHAELARVDRVQRVFGVDEDRCPALLLRFGDNLQRNGGLAGGLRPEDLHYATAREAADTQGRIQGDRAARYDIHRHDRAGSDAQHGALPKLLFHLGQGQIDCALALPLVKHGQVLLRRFVPGANEESQAISRYSARVSSAVLSKLKWFS